MRLIDADYLKNVILLHNYHGNNKDIVPYSDRKGYRLRQREVEEAIINAPTIHEREEGEWLHDKTDWLYRFYCSKCKYKLFEGPTNYCPNCGADMRKGIK